MEENLLLTATSKELVLWQIKFREDGVSCDVGANTSKVGFVLRSCQVIFLHLRGIFKTNRHFPQVTEAESEAKKTEGAADDEVWVSCN